MSGVRVLSGSAPVIGWENDEIEKEEGRTAVPVVADDRHAVVGCEDVGSLGVAVKGRDELFCLLDDIVDDLDVIHVLLYIHEKLAFGV
jgi:hypothetical protein